MFQKEGEFKCTITDAYICECKFAPQPGEINKRGELVQCFYDIALVVTEDATGSTGIWKGEISNRSGRGNAADRYRSDLTLETLQKLGFGVTTVAELEAQFYPNSDNSIGIPNIIGLKAIAVVEAREWNEKTYYDVRYLNSENATKKMTMDDLLAKRAAIAAAAAAPVPQPAAPVPQPASITAPAPAAAPVPPAAPAMPPKPACPY